MIYFTVFILIVLGRAFYAGMNMDRFRGTYRSHHDINGDKIFGYAFMTFIAALTWPVSLPIAIAVLLGQRFSKKKD